MCIENNQHTGRHGYSNMLPLCKTITDTSTMAVTTRGGSTLGGALAYLPPMSVEPAPNPPVQARPDMVVAFARTPAHAAPGGIDYITRI